MLLLWAKVDQSGSNEGVLRIPQSSSITGISPSDCLVSYSGHLWRESYLSAEMQSVYPTAPADWARMSHRTIKQFKKCSVIVWSRFLEAHQITEMFNPDFVIKTLLETRCHKRINAYTNKYNRKFVQKELTRYKLTASFLSTIYFCAFIYGD